MNETTTTPAPVTDERLCAAEVYRATWVQPAEYCEDEALSGSDFCARHTEPDEPDWDDHFADYDFSREE